MAGKLKPRIISPGEAWMNYVNSKQGHNAAAVTPEYLKPGNKATQDPFYHEKALRMKELARQLKKEQPRSVVKKIERNFPPR